jgi:hypothetical protein
MKNKSILLGAMILGASVLGASAFPLYLTSANGTISYTPSYSVARSTNVIHISTVAVNMKTIMAVVSNSVFLNDATIVPTNAMIAFDPYNSSTYLTNTSGFEHGLGGIVSVGISEIATSFRAANNATNETDKILTNFRVNGTAPDGLAFRFEVQGRGTLHFSVDKHSKGAMSISMPQGARYGANNNSDDGVCFGGFAFRGKGTPEWYGPFSTYWY